MSLLFIDGFDAGLGSAKWLSGNFSVDAAYGRNGNGARVGSSPNLYGEIAITAAGTVILGFASIVQSTTTNPIMIEFKDSGGTTQGVLRYYSDSSVGYCLGTGSGDLIRTAAGSIPIGEWHYIEIKIVVDNSAGEVTVNVDGAELASATGIDTQNTGTADIGRFKFNDPSSSYLPEQYLDDIYICDDAGSVNNDFLGDVRIETLFPSGNGSNSDLVGSDADSTDNYLLVDEATPDTGDYVESSTEGDKDTYAMDDLAGTDVTVIGVQTCTYAAKDDAGNKFLRPVVRSGGTDYPGTPKALSTTYVPILEVWETDPDTAAAWTPAGVNAFEVGQEVRDS